ncbi:MAG: hypothetical protein V1709_11675 [Planctomycetota bacterium]
MRSNSLLKIATVIMIVAYITALNYGGCGGGGGGGGSSGNSGAPTAYTQVTLLTPANNATNVSITQQLSWALSNNPGGTSYDVYLGTNNPPTDGDRKVSATASTNYNPGTLSYGTTYYWRIDLRSTQGTLIFGGDGALLAQGAVWRFTTEASLTETVSTPPQPSGATSGNTGTSYSYYTGGASSNLSGHSLEYRFDWGDGTGYSNWSPSTTVSKSWSSAGTYVVRARARCATHTSVVSGWSSGLSVTISSGSGLTLVKTATTNINGEAYFTDNSTGESVIIKPQDSDTLSPLVGIKVTFYDDDGFEVFMLNDPSENYLPSMGVYTHNSEHIIKMGAANKGTYYVARLDDEQIGLALWSWEDKYHMEYADGIYVKTINYNEVQEIMGRTQAIIKIELKGIEYLTGAKLPFDPIDIINEIAPEDSNPPQRWDMYNIQGTDTPLYIHLIPSNVPEVSITSLTVNGADISVSWQGTDITTYPDYPQFLPGGGDITVALGPTGNPDLTYSYRIVATPSETVYLDWTPYVLGQTSATVSSIPNGDYCFETKVKDEVENISEIASQSFSVGGAQESGNWAQMVAGNSHTIAIKTNGTLWAWGKNNYGQLGDGSTTNINTPTQIGTDTNWSVIAAGFCYTIALKTDGTLWAWGWNGYGQLGDGTTTNVTTGPKQIGTGTSWSAIAAADRHTIALKADGTLWAWGYNASGQLGDGTTTQKTTPTQIGTDTNWSVIAAGGFHTIALKADGTLWAWGDNYYGQLGDGTTTNVTTGPKQIGTGTSWSAIADGSSHNIAIKTNGTLWAWGYNASGQLGDGTTTQKTTPTQIGTDTNWSVIAAGGFHTIAIKTNGILWAWGDNASGQLGDGTTTQKTTPTQIGTDTNWSILTGGNGHSIAIKTDGTLWAWGLNDYGQLGLGDTTNRNIPTQVGTVASETISTPNSPTGTTSGNTSTSYNYSTGGSTSNLGHTVEYQFDWKGDGTVLSAWGSATQSKSWSSAGTYSVRARARCTTHISIVSGWSSGLSVNITASSDTISTPNSPTGTTSGTTGTGYNYSTGGSSSSLGHSLEYRFDLGDGSYSGWTSSTTIAVSWSLAGTYIVKAQSRCATHTSIVSNWSSGLSVSISGNTETISSPYVPTGSTNGTANTSYNYSTGGGSSNLGHSLEYRFNWGDGTYSSWSSSTTASHSWSSANTFNVQAQARCSIHTSVWSYPSGSISVTIESTAPTERIVDGNFETTSSWTGASYTTYYPRNGQWCLWLVNDNVYQTVAIPSGATSANLSFWLNVVSEETTTTTKYDYLYVEVLNSSGVLLQTLATYSNLDKGTIGVYNQKTGFNLTSYKGQTIRIRFRSTNDGTFYTDFRIDDVSLISDG